MVRVTNWLQRQRKHKKYLSQAKWFRQGRSKVYNQVRQALIKQWQHAYVSRRLKKRDFRRLRIERLNAVLRDKWSKYSVFTNHLQYFKLLKIDNRCCVGITKFRNKYCLEQFEIINTVENNKSNIIGFKIFDEKEIPNVLFIKENMIVFNNDGSLNIMN